MGWVIEALHYCALQCNVVQFYIFCIFFVWFGLISSYLGPLNTENITWIQNGVNWFRPISCSHFATPQHIYIGVHTHLKLDLKSDNIYIGEHKHLNKLAAFSKLGANCFWWRLEESEFNDNLQTMMIKITMMSLVTSSMSWSVRSGKMHPSPTSLESYQPSMHSPERSDHWCWKMIFTNPFIQPLPPPKKLLDLVETSVPKMT